MPGEPSRYFLPALPAEPADHAVSAAGADVALTYPPAGPGLCHCLSSLAVSYEAGAGPFLGLLTVQTPPGTVVWEVAIAQAGAAAVPFVPVLKGGDNAGLTVVLSAGGAGVIGRLNARHWVEQV
jgi:hypothetical protein